MNLKKVITLVLSLFIVISVIYLVTNEIEPGQNNFAGSSMENAVDVSNEAVNVKDRKIIIYYFYTTFRCPTCLTIEKYAAEAVKTGFKNEIANGKISWRAINMEEPENEHFQKEFKLFTKSVIIEEKGKNSIIRWKNLEKIWELVHNKNDFIKYIQDEVKQYLGSV